MKRLTLVYVEDNPDGSVVFARCDRCRHWARPGMAGALSECRAVNEGAINGRPVSRTQELLTAADFGCVLFEAKEEG